MLRSARRFLLFALSVLSLGGLFVCEAAMSRREERRNKVGASVVESLRLQGHVHVVIALDIPATVKSPVAELSEVRQRVAHAQERLLAKLPAFDYRLKHRFRAVPALAGHILSERALEILEADPSVRRVDLDVGGRGALSTTVPLIGADQRQAHGVTGKNVVVAILDSGIDTDHLDLRDALLREECFLDFDGKIDGRGLCPDGSDRQSGAGAAEDDAGHGTHVAGIISSNGTQSAIGVAPDTGIVSLKVTAGPSFGGVFGFYSEILAALDYILDHPELGIQIVNASLGSHTQFEGDCDSLTAYNIAAAAAIDALRANGVVTFASAGNGGSSTAMTSPACLHNVISVGASNRADAIAYFSNRNDSTDLFAPGVAVLSSGLHGGTEVSSGTSMAAPHAAGCAALLIQSGESTTPDEIEARLKASAAFVTDPVTDRRFPRVECGDDAPSVLLIESVTAVVVDGAVRIRWKTLSENETTEFRVLRRGLAQRSEIPILIGEPIPAVGTSWSGAEYEFIDRSETAASGNVYFVEDLDRHGKLTRHGPFTTERPAGINGRQTPGRRVR